MSGLPEKITLNGTPGGWADGCAALQPLLTRDAVVIGGGLLLKAAIAGSSLLLQIEPNFIDGRRNRHYDMSLPENAGPALTGDITSSANIRMLFGPQAHGSDPTVLLRTCIAVARSLVEGGLDRHCRLAPITRMALAEVGAVADPPAMIGQLADLPLPAAGA